MHISTYVSILSLPRLKQQRTRVNHHDQRHQVSPNTCLYVCLLFMVEKREAKKNIVLHTIFFYRNFLTVLQPDALGLQRQHLLPQVVGSYKSYVVGILQLIGKIASQKMQQKLGKAIPSQTRRRRYWLHRSRYCLFECCSVAFVFIMSLLIPLLHTCTGELSLLATD